MNTADNIILRNEVSSMPSQDENSMKNYDNLHEKKDFGTLEYPVSAYFLDLRNSYMNWIRWHWHEEMEILIIQEGTAEIFSDDTSYVIHPGQGVIINQNVIHCIHSLNQQNCTFYAIVFQPEFLFGYRSSYLQAQYLLPIQNYQLFRMFLLDENDPWHKRMLASLNNAISVNLTQSFGYELATKGYLCHFWSDLISHLPRPQKQAVSSRASLDEQAGSNRLLCISGHIIRSQSLWRISPTVSISVKVSVAAVLQEPFK